MDKVIVRLKGMSQALFSLATAGCETVEISVVEHAVKVEGIRGDERLTLHIWSTEAEETEAGVGKGERQLTEEEIELLDAGKCPICEAHGQLSKGPKAGLAVNVSCDAGHLFWVPVKPFVPEYLGMPALEAEEKEKAEPKPKACSRCNKPIEEGVDSNICGTCADDLRAEEAAKEAAEEIKEQEKTGETESTE